MKFAAAMIILAALLAAGCGQQTGGGGQVATSTKSDQAASTKSSGPKKASNGDDAKDLHNRAQQAVNRAEVCLASLYLAAKSTKNVNTMASSLQDARSICNASRDYLSTNSTHGFTDQDTELFAAADYAKSATNAGLAYLDTQAPSKLADFVSHVRDANSAYKQGLEDLNARLSELGVAHVKG